MKERICDYREEQIFFIAYTLWMFDALIGISMWKYIEIINEASNYIRMIAFGFLILQFLLKKEITSKDIKGVFCIVFICIVANHSVYNRYIIDTMLLIYFSANVNYHRLISWTLILQSLFMIFTIFASYIGIIENVIWGNEGERLRQSLGYDYCAYLAHLTLFCSLMWLCIRSKLYIADMFVLLIINTTVYYWTQSRADYFLGLFAIGGGYLWRNCKGCLLIKKMLAKYAFFLLAITTFVMQYIYNDYNETIVMLDNILSDRLQLGHKAIFEIGFSLFGKSVQWFGAGSLSKNPFLIYNYVDCAFLKETLSYGIIYFILLCYAFFFVGKTLINDKNNMICWAIIVSLVYATVNAHLCMPVFNVFILLLGIIFRNKSYKKYLFDNNYNIV